MELRALQGLEIPPRGPVATSPLPQEAEVQASASSNLKQDLKSLKPGCGSTRDRGAVPVTPSTHIQPPASLIPQLKQTHNQRHTDGAETQKLSHDEGLGLRKGETEIQHTAHR